MPSKRAREVHKMGCDCCATAPGVFVARRVEEDEPPPSLIASILPALACAICPACVASYATALSALGISVSFGEEYHHALLVVAVLATLAFHGYRAWRTRRFTALAIATVGCALIVGGHLLDENSLLAFAGVGVLVGGSLIDVLAQRRLNARRPPRREQVDARPAPRTRPALRGLPGMPAPSDDASRSSL